MIRRCLSLGFVFVVACGLLGGCQAGAERASHSPSTLPTASAQDARLAELRLAINMATDYVVRATNADGRFDYLANLDPTMRVDEEDYNTIRHAGTIYALAQAQATYPTPERKAALLRATTHLRQQVEPLVEGRPMLGVWSERNPREVLKEPPTVALGGIGLGLVALCSVESLYPQTVPLDELRGLGRGALYMQKPSGQFHSKYVPSDGGLQDDWESLYYPGEAALGLVMLYEIDRDSRWLNAAIRALNYLAAVRRDQPRVLVPHDHWVLLATARLFAVRDLPADVSLQRELLVRHAVQICDAMMSVQLLDPRDPDLRGAFTPTGETAPTATRLEGLLATLTFLTDASHPDLRRQMRASIDAGVHLLLGSQVMDGRRVGAIPRCRKLIPELMGDRELERATEVRIDYVQHALSAFLSYGELLAQEAQ